MTTERDPGKYVPVTPSDTLNFTWGTTRGISLAVGGTLTVTYEDGDKETLTLPSGVHPIHNVSRVWATGTAATGISAI